MRPLRSQDRKGGMARDPITVAVITRTKDRPLLLDRAVRSVMQQTLGDLHMVIVNDGGDASVVDAVAARHHALARGRLSVVHHADSRGMEAASNAGILASDSRYLAILDDDDSWHPRFLETTVDAMARSGRMGAVTATKLFVERVDDDGIRLLHSVPFTSDTHLLRARAEKGEHGISSATAPDADRVSEIAGRRPPPTSLFRLLEANQFTSNAFVYERAALDVVGLYDESLPVLGDWDFNLRFLRHFDVDFIDAPLAYYHHREPGSTAMGNTVTDQDGSHERVRQQLLNRYLRADLDGHGLGLGYLANLLHRDRDRAAFLRAAYDDLQDGLAQLSVALRSVREAGDRNDRVVAESRRELELAGQAIDRLARHLGRLEELVQDRLSAEAAEERIRDLARAAPDRVRRRVGRLVHGSSDPDRGGAE